MESNTPPKTNIDTKNDGLEDVYLLLKPWLFWGSYVRFQGFYGVFFFMAHWGLADTLGLGLEGDVRPGLTSKRPKAWVFWAGGSSDGEKGRIGWKNLGARELVMYL